MMQETIGATFLFWATFVFSAGPFWIATMAASPDTTFQKLYSDYMLYLVFGWLPVLLFTSLVSGFVTGTDFSIQIAMHILGGGYVLYLAYKVLYAKIVTGQSFDFNWKNMCLVTYLNPKVYILLPVGFLSAKLTDNMVTNIAFFYFSGIPVFLFGVYFWGMIGRAGARISLRYINYFNALLLASFGTYLIYNGFMMSHAQ
jgi:hypothetical protein